MSKLNISIVAALLALAVLLGSVAVARTTGLGAASRAATDASIAAKTRQLSAYERKLRAALGAKAPAQSGPASAPAQQPRIVYHRPPPVVVVKHTSRGDDGRQAEGSGGDD